MIVAVIGLGSMGKRRIRLIRELYPNHTVIGVDSRPDRRTEASERFGIKTEASPEDIAEKVDCAFVCTSPLSHASLINTCLNYGWHVFTELNLVDDGYKENIQLSKDKECVLFLSSTFLYREETGYIRSKVSEGGKWNYIYHIGQYLPDWHPWENYRDFFAGNKETNGCREILAIELPWLIATFGEVTDVSVLSDRMSSLDIDYEDNYMISLVHADGSKGLLAVDVVSPVAVRKFEAYTENKFLSWEGTPETLFEYDPEERKINPVSLDERTEHEEGYSAFIVENAYRNEIQEFFDIVFGKKKMQYGFSQDQKVLELIDSIGA